MSVAYVSLLLLAVIFGLSNCATRRFPPERFVENPNLRMQSLRDDAIQDYRLPNQTQPIEYSVTLSTNVHIGETGFNGTVIIDLEVLEDTNTIVLHARQLDNFVASIRRKDTITPSYDLKPDYELDREFLSLTPIDSAVSFPKDTNWTLTISYNGTLRSDNGGFYLSTYTDDNGQTRFLATTQFESTDARHAFPCYDEPSKRANFTITLRHDPSYNAISNMPVNIPQSSSGITVFQTSPKMPSYLVAFIVSDFVSTEGELNELPQRVFSRKEASGDQEWALTSGMLVEKRLDEYFGVPFALPKLDQAAMPDFAAGAMENWGLATYREEYLLYNNENSTVSTQSNIATIISHEDAHMWFGDLVSIKWWTYLWLKEGFATLFENLAVDLAYPEWDIFQVFHVGSYQQALTADATPSSRPMTHYVQKPSEISLLYDSISYAKAGSVLNMWRNALTNKVFQRGLHNYLTVNQFNSADEWQLFTAIKNAAKEENYEVPQDIPSMLVSWTQQSNYPLLTVKRNYNDGSFVITQEAFFNNETIKQNKTWFVPTNYAVQSNPDFRNTEATIYLLNQTSETVNNTRISNDDWLILNKQSTGFYRINYDERNWELIIDGLISKPHKIHLLNRAQLINDAYRFAVTSRLPHSTLLTLLTYLPKEDQYAPWASVNSVITLFNRYLSGDADYDNFKYFISQLVSDPFDKFGVNDVHGEQHLAKFTRSVLINLACLAGLQSCLEETNAKLIALIDHNVKIEPNLQAPIYCNGLKNVNDTQFDFIYNKLMTSNDQAERRLLISSLGCSQNTNQIKKFISSSIDTNNQLRSQERTTLLAPAYSRGEVGLLASIEFLDEHWEEYGRLNSGFGGVNPLYQDLTTMSAHVVNENQKQKYSALISKVNGSPFVEGNLETITENNIQANYDWLALNRDPLMNWVRRYRTGGSATLTASFVSVALAISLIVSRLF